MIDPATGSAIIGSVQLVFGFALLPTVCDRRARVPRSSSGVTAAGLWILGLVYLGMGLWSAAACAAFTAAMWSFVFVARPT